MKTLPFVLCLWTFLGGVRSATILQPVTVDTLDDNQKVIEQWSFIEKTAKEFMRMALTRMTPTMVRMSSELPFECSDSLLRLLLGLKNMKLWAVSMVDASGKIPSGIISGTTSELGSYQQCLNVKVPDSISNEILFKGQYCTMNVRMPLPTKPDRISIGKLIAPFDNNTFETELFEKLKDLAPFMYFITIRFGLCFPSTCAAKDIKHMVDYVVKDYHLSIEIPRCETEDTNMVVLDAGQIVMIVILSIFALLMIIGTVLTYYWNEIKEHNNNVSWWVPWAKGFCAYTNAKKILSTNTSLDGGQLSCLHGIRFYSMTWVILGHTYLLVNFHQFRDFNNSRNLMQNFAFQTIFNATVSVDSFFFISGVLMSYVSLEFIKTHGKEKFSPVILIVHRMWRLLPSAMIVLGIVLLIPLFNEGPMWHEGIDFIVRNTKNNWWTVPIFGTNILHMSHMSLPHYWYIASDMQMFILAVVYIILLLKKKVFGLVFNTILLVLPITISAILSYIYELPPTMLNNNVDPDGLMTSMRQSYVLPHTHLGPYAIGLALGYFLTSKQKIHLSIVTQICGWLLAILCNVAVLYGVYPWNTGTPYSQGEAIVYGALHRSAWALGLAWVVLACVSGNGGIVNHILCWKALIPLSKITYLAFLLHLPIILIFMAGFHGTADLSNTLAVWVFCGHVVVTFALSFFCRLLFEGPLQEIEKIVLDRLLKLNKKEKVVGSPGNSSDVVTTNGGSSKDNHKGENA